MPMLLKELMGRMPRHRVGSLPAPRLVFRHDANRAEDHLRGTATGAVSSKEMESVFARDLGTSRCSAAAIADGTIVFRFAPWHPTVFRKDSGALLAARLAARLSDRGSSGQRPSAPTPIKKRYMQTPICCCSEQCMSTRARPALNPMGTGERNQHYVCMRTA